MGVMSAPMPPDQLELPLFSWTDGNHLTTREGARLQRWGSVKKACAILDDCDRETIYDLIASGQVAGYKRNPKRSNSHYRVDLLGVWHLKQEQISNRK